MIRHAPRPLHRLARLFFAAAWIACAAHAVADDAPVKSSPTGLVDALNALSGGPHISFRQRIP